MNTAINAVEQLIGKHLRKIFKKSKVAPAQCWERLVLLRTLLDKEFAVPYVVVAQAVVDCQQLINLIEYLPQQPHIAEFRRHLRHGLLYRGAHYPQMVPHYAISENIWREVGK